jgi:hypothetical protein
MSSERRAQGFSAALAIVAGVTMVAAAAPAQASATKCRSAIVAATTKYLVKRTAVLGKCHDGVVAGKRPGPCPDLKAHDAFTKLEDLLGSTIAKACGGADKVCGAGSALDETLASIGWDIGTCPNVGNGTCTNAIVDCNGVTACVACIGEQVMDQAFGLYFNAAALPVDESVGKCLRAIGKGSAASFAKMSKALGKCWLAVNKADSGGSFSCPDASAAVAAGKARASNRRTICKGCRGANTKCGDADDVPREITGFPATCPAIGSCAGPVETLQDIAGCADCVTEALVDGAVRSTIPAYTVSSPPQCVPGPTPTPGG